MKMKTITDLVKEGREESLRLDLYFYEQELNNTSSPLDKEKVLEKIQLTEKLLNELRD